MPFWIIFCSLTVCGISINPLNFSTLVTKTPRRKRRSVKGYKLEKAKTMPVCGLSQLVRELCLFGAAKMNEILFVMSLAQKLHDLDVEFHLLNV